MKSDAVLIVDDEKNIRLTMAEALESLGLEIDTAADGEEAVSKLKAKRFALVLLDIVMPGIGGMDVLADIHKTNPDTRVIIVTAHGSIESAVEALKMGACDFIEKPFVPDKLRELVRRVLDRDRMKAQEAADFASFIELAKRCIWAGKFDAAIEYLRKAIAIEPNRPEGFNLLGAMLEITGSVLEAQKNYRVAVSLDPSYKPAIENLKRTANWHEKNKKNISF
ncbi:MAG: response regulator [Planctomycetes bacterium]|nr:response regulator [Planctomycetota bacterium]